MIINKIDLYSYLNYDNDEVLNINNVEINLSLKESNQVEQGFQNSDEQ